MTAKTEKLNKFLQQIRDALPERITRKMSGKHDSKDHLVVPKVGWLGCNYYDKPDPDSVFLCFTGSSAARTRTYQIKNGVLKTERLVKVIAEAFDKCEAFDKDYAAKQRESKKHFVGAESLGPIVFEKVDPGPGYRKVKEASYAGGFKLFVGETTSGYGQVWAQDENTVKGTIPFTDLPIEKLNEVLKILGESAQMKYPDEDQDDYDDYDDYDDDYCNCYDCREDDDYESKLAPKPKPIPFRLSDYSPNTNMILGALFSGGDPKKMAQMIVDSQEKQKE